MTQSSRKGLDLIKQFEGCKLSAYLCPAGVWTIGWGRTTNVKRGDTCTQAQADAWLVQEYDAFERKVHALIRVAVTPNQLGALVSFAYNVGVGALQSSTLLRLLNQGDYAGAAAQFARWNRAAGKTLAGLTRRRKAEADLFVQP
ncbi:lysozyme [Sphingobium sp. PAMC28499]|uniref:lysozyme n=1 Tax=Sphingobium sp. PAMC28499 TaxID=2565554 RepID=UPI00109E21D7|nr:lysozyme [Sphingobium sp. PAMC28499]QCB39224.1 lysozyme [Sphingobium sp. PAMC28499]